MEKMSERSMHGKQANDTAVLSDRQQLASAGLLVVYAVLLTMVYNSNFGHMIFCERATAAPAYRILEK